MQAQHIFRFTVPTATKAGEPNINGRVYTEEMFNNMEKPGIVYLTEQIPPYVSIIKALVVDAPTVLGTVSKIENGFITVEAIDEISAKKIMDFLKEGYVAGMRYLTNNNGFMRLIAYDMIKNPSRTDSNTEINEEE